VLLWQRYDNNKMVAMRYYVLHLQQYSHRLNLIFLLRITHTIISQSTADSSWITLYV